MNLSQKMVTLSKTGPMPDYLKQIKELADKLAVVVEVFKGEVVVFYTKHGLTLEYSSFKSGIRARDSPITFCELTSLLESKEISILCKI